MREVHVDRPRAAINTKRSQITLLISSIKNVISGAIRHPIEAISILSSRDDETVPQEDEDPVCAGAVGEGAAKKPHFMLIAEMSMPCSFDQKGTFGFVTHLCNRPCGDQAQTPSIPDNNSEITFGRMGEELGWFFFLFQRQRWGFPQMG